MTETKDVNVNTIIGRHGGGEAAVCAPRAEVFGGGAPFVRGWASARRATSSLADELIRAGLDEDFAGLRADVSVRGDGLVCIGPVTADAAHRLAVLLARGLCVELDDTLDGIGDATAA